MFGGKTGLVPVSESALLCNFYVLYCKAMSGEWV